MSEHTRLKSRKTAEYIQDISGLGNPFLLLLVAFCATRGVDCLPTASVWLVLLLGFALNEAICSGIKFIWHKPRPNGQQFEGGLEKIDAGSFPSIHAARISFVYSSLAYLQYCQNQSFLFPVVALLVIALVGYSRVFLRKHFPVDVLAGYGFGSAMSYVGWSFWV